MHSLHHVMGTSEAVVKAVQSIIMSNGCAKPVFSLMVCETLDQLTQGKSGLSWYLEDMTHK